MAGCSAGRKAYLRGSICALARGQGQIFLMHQRLSILDLSAAGRQPMSDPTGRWHVVFNGEIYNYLELRHATGRSRPLSSIPGPTPKCWLHAFIEWDTDALTRFVGMFAFALLDTQRGRVFLARDFFGIKPLYYARTGELLMFGSEIKALLGCPGVRRTVHPGRLYEYLRYGLTDHGGETLLEQVRQLPPGHYLDLSRDRGWAGAPVQDWKPTVGEAIDVSFDEAATRVRELFLDNVRLHLRSDVPVGAALSGGIDSSAIVAAMRAVEPRLELHAFSYIADRARPERGTLDRHRGHARRACGVAQNPRDAGGAGRRSRPPGRRAGRAVRRHEHLCPAPRLSRRPRPWHPGDAGRPGTRTKCWRAIGCSS